MGDNGLIFSSAKEGKWVLIIMIMDGPKTLVIGLRIGIAMAHGTWRILGTITSPFILAARLVQAEFGKCRKLQGYYINVGPGHVF